MRTPRSTSIRYTRPAGAGEPDLRNETLAGNQWVRIVLLTGYYLLIIAALLLLYGRGDFSTPSFIYQGF